MSRIVKVLLAALLVASGFAVPAIADGVTIGGKVTAVKDLSLVGATVSLEKYDQDADTFNAIATATVTPSPAPTSTSAPYKFDNVEDGTYRVKRPLTKADVATSKFGVSTSEEFVVTEGKITVKDKPYPTIPDFKLNAMGKFAVKAVDSSTNTAIPNAIFTISGSFNGEDTTFSSFTDPNALGTAILPVPAAGTYSIKIVDSTGLHQTFTSDDKSFGAGYSNPSPCNASSCTYKPIAGGNLNVTVTSGKDGIAGAIVHLLVDDEEVAVATASKSGVASFLGLPVGDLSMWVGGPIGSAFKDSDAKTVTIVAGQTVSASQVLADGFTISGLLSSSDGPVAGARVDVQKVDEDGNETPASPTETGKDGRFVTNGLSAGTYNLYFVDETSDLQDFRLPGSLRGVVVKTANIPNQNVTLPSAGVVAGRVTAAKGTGVPLTNVQLINANGITVATLTSDNKGGYRFPGIVTGSYTVKFSNDSYRVGYSGEFTVASNKISTQDVTLFSGSGLSGKVTSTASGQAFASAQVSIYSSQDSGLIPDATTITEADGSYEFTGLQPGSYRIKFDTSSSNPTAGIFWQPVDQAKTNAKSFGQAGDFTTRPGVTVKNVNPVPVTPWASVTGKVTVTDPTDGVIPVENATVTVVSADGLVAKIGSTDADGNFAIPVPDGKYGIKIAAAGYSTGYVGNVVDQPTLVARYADAVEVKADQGKASFENSWDLNNWSIDLAGNGGTVKVTVVDETKSPVSEGVLIAYNSQGNAVAFTDACDENGTFVLHGLRGKFSFSYESAGAYAKRFVGGTASLSDAGTTIVNILDGAVLKLNLVTVACPSLVVKIVTSADSKAPLYTDDLTIEVYTLDAGEWSLDSDLTLKTNEGTANIGVKNGVSYRIRILPDSYLLAPIWVGGVPLANTVDDASAISIPATGKAPTLDNVLLNVGAGIIKGHVADGSDGVVSGTVVELFDSAGNLIKSATSREDGVYNLYRISPDTYTLRFTAERYSVQYSSDIVVTGGASTQADVTLKPASGVTGQLISTDDEPVVGATVNIYSASGSGVTPVQTVVTSEDGTYNFVGLVAGSYKVRFDGTTAAVPTSAFWYSSGDHVGSFNEASTVVTTLGEYTKNVDPKPTQSWSIIKGTILANKNAVSGTTIYLVTEPKASLTGTVFATAVTDENGNFALYAPDGSYQIKVRAPGFAAGFIDATEAGEALLSPSAVGAAIVSVKDYSAKIDGGLKTDDLTLDLAGFGGSITVTVKDDSDNVVTDGEVTVYDSTGNVAGYVAGAQAGVFTISGLSGTYRVSYVQDGVFAKTFYGDTSNIADSKTKTAKIDKTNKPAVTINVKILPKLTVNVVDGATPAAAYKKPVTVEVYQQIGSEWTLNDALSEETSSGSLSFGVVNKAAYRIRVVPNSGLLTPVWVGAARLAKSVDLASSITIPASGPAPVLGSVVMNSLAGVMRGVVSDSDSAGVPGAQVNLIDNSGAVVDSVSTRSDGGYQLRQIPGGIYTVKFLADGYAIKYVRKYQVVPGQSAALDSKLTPASGISGQALLSGEPTAPIIGADVSVYSATGTGLTALQTVQTDEEGNYNFIGLMPGSYKVYFDNRNAVVPAESFWYGVDANAATFKEASPITAELGAYATGTDPKPATAWTLFTGNIHDGQWAVVGGSVSLIAFNLVSDSGKSLTGTTDDDGNFEIYAPPGDYRVKIASSGYLVGFVSSSDTGAAITGTSADTASVLTVSEEGAKFGNGLTGTSLSSDLGANGGKISVTVKDELGQLVTGGMVKAYDQTGNPVAVDDVGVNGVFTLTGLGGYYRVSYQLDGVFAETFVGDTKDLGAPGTKTVTVSDGANTPVAIRVKSLPKLTVNIYSSGKIAYKQPVTVEVYTLTDDEWLLDTGLTQETSEGSLTFGVENSNQYRIRLVPADPELAPIWLGPNSSALTVDSAKSILIPASGAVPAVSGLVNVNAATISGAVTDSFKTLMPGVTVQLIAANGDVVSETTTLEDGTYGFIQVIPGTYKIRFAAERFSDKVFRAVVVAPGSAITQNAVLDSASGVSGRVVGSATGLASGPGLRGLAGATIGLYDATGTGLSALRTEVTDKFGYYNFSGLVPGSYRIRIDATTAKPSSERVWYAGSGANVAGFASASTIKAVRGELLTDIDPAPVKFWTEFDGVIKAGSLAVSGATVTLMAVKGDEITGQTDGDGLLTMYAPDGDYRVQVAAAGYPLGYLSVTGSGVVLDPLAPNATLLRIANGTASFPTGLDLLSDPLDLASTGGSLQVQVLDGTTVVTQGRLTVYNRAGEVVAFTESATGGVFKIDGLRGEYKVSYELPGSYELTFLGGSNAVNDPQTAQVKVRDKGVALATIAVVAQPLLTVNVKSGGTTYSQPVTVNVFQKEGKVWNVQPDLGGTTFTGSHSFGVTRGEIYRVQVVTDDLSIANAWVGNANALSVDTAASFEIPLTGNTPALPEVNLLPAVQVTVPLMNNRPVALENVVAHIDVTVGGKFVEFSSQSLGTLEPGNSESVTISQVPATMFPIRVTGTSSNSAEVSWTSQAGAPTADVTSDTLKFSQVAIPAVLTGYINTFDGFRAKGLTVTLTTDEGDVYASTKTDKSGNYEFKNLPLGVHLTVSSNPQGGFMVPDGDTDFTARSGDELDINFVQHYSVLFGGVVLDAEGNPREAALVKIYRLNYPTLKIRSDDVYNVYTDANGNWTFDGSEFGAEVGKYAFFADGLDSDFTPAYLGNADCMSQDTLPNPNTSCAVAKPAQAVAITTSKKAQTFESITLVLGAPDNAAPTGVKISKARAITSEPTQTWQWTGTDSTDGTALRSEVVIASANYGQPMSTWSDPIDVTSNSYTIIGVKGTTYCFALRMFDKSGNASPFTTAKCTTFAMDDTALKPVKASMWSQVALTGAFLGKVTSAKKNVKSAVLTVAKAEVGQALCIYYGTGPKFGAFVVTINGKKIGKPVKTAGKAGQIKSVCFVTKIKASSKIAITAPKTGNGIQIDGYAITVAKPSAPLPQ